MTAILLSDLVWEGISSEMTDVLSGLRDGQFFKQLDTGESYFRRSGVWEFVNLGLSFIKATKSGRITTDEDGIYDVVFNTPFISDDYTVSLSCEEVGVNCNVAGFSNITKNGFRITTRRIKNRQISANVVVSWLATRNYDP